MERTLGKKMKHETDFIFEDAATQPKRTCYAEDNIPVVVKIEKEEPDQEEENESDVERREKQDVAKTEKEGNVISTDTYNIHISLVLGKNNSDKIKLPIQRRKKTTEDVIAKAENGRPGKEVNRENIGEKLNPAQKKRKKEKTIEEKRKKTLLQKNMSNTVKALKQRKMKTTEDLITKTENERSGKQVDCNSDWGKSNPLQKKREKPIVGKKEGKKIVLEWKRPGRVKLSKHRKKKNTEVVIAKTENERPVKQANSENDTEKSNVAQKKRKKEKADVRKEKRKKIVLEKKMSDTVNLCKQKKTNEDVNTENEILGKQINCENDGEKSNPAQKKIKKRKSGMRNEGKKTTSGKKTVDLVTKPKKATVAAKKSMKTRVNKPKFETKTELGKHGNDRTRGTSKFVGAHVSIAGGLHKSVLDAVAIGASAFGLFLKSQRTWKSKPLKDHDAEKFLKTYKIHGFSPNMILPHGSYLMNCGSPDPEILQKSRDTLVDELQRCEKLGLTLFNFHPGSSCGTISTADCIKNIAESINQAHFSSTYVTTVIENMCCQGNTVGGKFKELRMIIDLVKDKARVGVCLDTCHAFAAGYDLSTETGFEEMMKEFEEVIGFKYLKAMHVNDSKGKVGCHLDRHENIGRGEIGIAGFQRIMRHPKFNNIPMILETPCAQDDTYINEINKLYTMCKD